MTLLDEYFKKVQIALLNFQFIEESIKMYITFSYWIVIKKLEKQLPYNFSYNDVKNNSLGKLLKKFEKFNSEKKLINEIKQLIKDRNFIVHQAYLLTYEEQKDDKYLSEQIKNLEKIIVRSKKCLNELSQELQKIEKIKNSIK